MNPPDSTQAFVPVDQPLIWYFKDCFTATEMAQLRGLVDEEKFTGELGDKTVKTDVRRSQVHWLDLEEYGWVYQRLLKIAKDANQKYGFDIDGVSGPAQLAIYDESHEGFYDWHMDWSKSYGVRKISISIPICDRDEYEGGDLEFNLNGCGDPVRQVAGTAITFPSFLMHRVTPVTRGRRYSLVAWIGGPQLR